MPSSPVHDRLNRRALVAGIPLSDRLSGHLEAYYRLLAKWNAKVNLTAFQLTEEGEDAAIDRLLIEPVAASAYIPATATTLLDVGSGGGSPAIPMLLARPALRLQMVEAKTRKAVFLKEAIRILGLTGSTVEASRFEELLSNPSFLGAYDVVSLRAVRVDPATLSIVQAFLKQGGQLFLFRTIAGSDLTEAIPPQLHWMASHPLLESLGSQLAIFEKQGV